MEFIELTKDQVVGKAHELRKENWRLVCITGTDLSTETEAKMEVLYHLARGGENLHLRVETDGVEPFPSVLPVWGNALFLENELKEMLGIPVDGIEGQLLLRHEDEIKTPLKRLRGISYETQQKTVEKQEVAQ